MSFFGPMYYALICRTSLTVSSTAILTSPSNYAYFGARSLAGSREFLRAWHVYDTPAQLIR